MYKKIHIPGNIIKYILFQRTQYLSTNLIARILKRISIRYPFFYKFEVGIKSFLFKNQIKEEYNNDIREEYNIIKRYLPQKAMSVLDIGCGIAGIDLLINEHHNSNIDIFLIDKTLIDEKIYYYFEEKGSFYNSLSAAKNLLIENGIDRKKVHTQEATNDNKIIFKGNFDIIISLISWGFHYPVSTYLDECYKKLNNNGVLIIDIRKNVGGEKELGTRFNNIKVISEGKKYRRLLVRN